jgi:hypothetical protein
LDSAKARAFLSILVTTRRDALGVFAICESAPGSGAPATFLSALSMPDRDSKVARFLS